MRAIIWTTAVLVAAITYSGLSSSAASGSASTAARQTAAAQRRAEPFAGVLDEHPAIGYAERATADRVGRLAAAIAQGERTLEHDARAGYLPAVLAALDISPESQLLVFSKTGLQRAHTSPRNPRALFFDDEVIVGYIPGAPHLEVAAHDPAQGVIFYTIEQGVTVAPKVVRRTNCLTCHVSGSTLDVPGVITRSNFTNEAGELIPQLGFHIVDHRTPLSQRWGGWFVTGKYDVAPYGGVTHIGNIATAMHPVNDRAAGSSNEVLFQWMETNASALGYPSHESDIAALLLFDHQMRAINLLTRFGWEARVAAHDGAMDFTRGPLGALADDVADYLLFRDAVPPPARLTPRPGFAAQFTAKGPRDSRGRSLRELDLSTQLLKYGCSYMVYAPAFDGLPAAARQAVYARMRARLQNPATTGGRETIAILQETKPDWASSQ